MQGILISNCGIKVTSHQDRCKCIGTRIARNFRRSEIGMKSDRERRQGQGSSFRSSGGALSSSSTTLDRRSSRAASRSSSFSTPLSTTNLARSLSRVVPRTTPACLVIYTQDDGGRPEETYLLPAGQRMSVKKENKIKLNCH